MRKTILITGAGGYIGSRMVEKYLIHGFRIIALDRYFFGDVLSDLKGKNLKIVKDDTRLFDKRILEKVDVVIDLASISNDASGSLNPRLTRDINYNGSVRVASLAKEMGVGRYVFSSSCSVYGKAKKLLDEESKVSPVTEYAKSKLLSEKKILELAGSSFCVTILRNATVFGLSTRRMRFDLMVNLMTLTAWKNNKIFIYGGGKQWRPLIHIDDCIDAFLATIYENNSEKINRQILNVGSDTLNYQVLQVAPMFKKYFPKLKIENFSSSTETRNYRVNFKKIKKLLGFSTKRTIDDGIIEILDALKSGKVQADIRTHTLNYYKYLMESEKLVDSLKLKGKLFL